MLPPDAETRHKAFELIKQVLGARGEWSADEDGRECARSRACSASTTQDARVRSPFANAFVIEALHSAGTSVEK